MCIGAMFNTDYKGLYIHTLELELTFRACSTIATKPLTEASDMDNPWCDIITNYHCGNVTAQLASRKPGSDVRACATGLETTIN